MLYITIYHMSSSIDCEYLPCDEGSMLRNEKEECLAVIMTASQTTKRVTLGVVILKLHMVSNMEKIKTQKVQEKYWKIKWHYWEKKVKWISNLNYINIIFTIIKKKGPLSKSWNKNKYFFVVERESFSRR